MCYDSVDRAIEKVIETLTTELNQTGWLSTPTPQRRDNIIKQIAELRASMNPQCNHK